MNNLRQFHFYSNDHRNPYIQELIEYNISEGGGYIHYDGYYYVNNEEFPKRLFFITTLRDEIPYEEKRTDTDYSCKYKIIEEDFYEIEIYDRIKIKNTSEFSEMEDEDGSTMRVCFYPTDEQKIMFKIINKFDNYDSFSKRIDEI